MASPTAHSANSTATLVCTRRLPTVQPHPLDDRPAGWSDGRDRPARAWRECCRCCPDELGRPGVAHQLDAQRARQVRLGGEAVQVLHLESEIGRQPLLPAARGGQRRRVQERHVAEIAIRREHRIDRHVLRRQRRVQARQIRMAREQRVGVARRRHDARRDLVGERARIERRRRAAVGIGRRLVLRVAVVASDRTAAAGPWSTSFGGSGM